MKPLVFKYNSNNTTYFVESFSEEDARKALESKLNTTLRQGLSPNITELKRLWNKKDDLKPILTIRDIYSEDYIKRADAIYRVKFWISRLYQQDSIDWSKYNDPKYKYVEYCTKTNEGVINRFFTEGRLVPNTGFVVPIDVELAASQKLYLHENYISVVKTVESFLKENQIEDIEVGSVTLKDLVDGLLCGQ